MLLFYILFLIFILLCIVRIYFYLTSEFNYFKNQGIKGPRPIPLYGNTWNEWKGKWAETDILNMKKYGKTFGFFRGRTPCLYTCDTNLIRSVCVKDYNSFDTHDFFFVETKMTKYVVAFLSGEDWKHVRVAIGNLSTSYLKSVIASNYVHKTCQKFVNRFTQLIETNQKINLIKECDPMVLDLMSKTFGEVETNAVGKLDHPFLVKSKGYTFPQGPIISLGYQYKLFSKVLAWLSICVPLTYFFKIANIIVDEKTSTVTKETQIIGRDPLSSMLRGYIKYKGTNHILARKEVISSQLGGLLSVTVDTTSPLTSMTLYMCAKFPNIQTKVRNEIQHALDLHGEITYTMLNELRYLDNCIKEVLRLFPPAARVDRACCEDKTYGGIKIKKGTLVRVPVCALHRHPDYYENPDEFLPERWSQKNKIDPVAFQPFGFGPRGCPGERPALLIAKLAICSLIPRFNFFLVPESVEQIELKYNALSFIDLSGNFFIGMSQI